jgi:hypothetical protein
MRSARRVLDAGGKLQSTEMMIRLASHPEVAIRVR